MADVVVAPEHSLNASFFHQACYDLVTQVAAEGHERPIGCRSDQHPLRLVQGVEVGVKHCSDSSQCICEAHAKQGRPKANCQKLATISQDCTSPLCHSIRGLSWGDHLWTAEFDEADVFD